MLKDDVEQYLSKLGFENEREELRGLFQKVVEGCCIFISTRAFTIPIPDKIRHYLIGRIRRHFKWLLEGE